MNSHEVFIHIHQVCFAGTGAIVRLPQCQWSKPGGYGKISQCITTTKHSKAKNRVHISCDILYYRSLHAFARWFPQCSRRIWDCGVNSVDVSLHNNQHGCMIPVDNCFCNSLCNNSFGYIEGILPKGSYLPSVSMAGWALLAGYHRYLFFHYLAEIWIESLCHGLTIRPQYVRQFCV